jgi:hypothetical protein
MNYLLGIFLSGCVIHPFGLQPFIKSLEIPTFIATLATKVFSGRSAPCPLTSPPAYPVRVNGLLLSFLFCRCMCVAPQTAKSSLYCQSVSACIKRAICGVSKKEIGHDHE